MEDDHNKSSMSCAAMKKPVTPSYGSAMFLTWSEIWLNEGSILVIVTFEEPMIISLPLLT